MFPPSQSLRPLRVGNLELKFAVSQRLTYSHQVEHGHGLLAASLRQTPNTLSLDTIQTYFIYPTCELFAKGWSKQ